ncbi:MAG: GNAT family N-acetyltransferase [Faecalibacillus sp.]
MEIKFKEMEMEDLDQLVVSYIETFNSKPWNDQWSKETAQKRLHQMLNTEDSYGLCAYYKDFLCGAILGGMEQYYNGKMFNIKEFWVRNDLRGQGIGSLIFKEFEKRLKEKDIQEIYLMTIKEKYTMNFYNKQDMFFNDYMVFMQKMI